MYCNSCLKLIKKDKETYCEQCGVPICKTCANHCMVCGKELCDTCYAENNFRCEDCLQPDGNFDIIRRSYIEQYVGCPHSLYLQLCQGITPAMGAAAQLGVIVHQIIENLDKVSMKLDMAKELLSQKIFDWNVNTDDTYSVITMELEEIGKVCLENYWLIKDQFKEKCESERQIIFSLDDELPKVSCTIDRIRWVGEDIHIHDWKTGKPMAGKKLVEDLQPPLYIYAVYKEFGTLPKSFTLHYLHPNKHIVYRYVGEMKYEIKTSRSTYILDVNEALERTKNILTNIQNNNFPVPNDIQWRCDKICWFKQSKYCSGCEKESWKQANKKYAEVS